MDFRDAFVSFIQSENREGSNRASSYIRAIDLLDSILSRKAPKELNADSIWSISSAEHIHRLYELIIKHQKLGQDGVFKGEEPSSYWKQNFCSAALKSYKEFLVTHLYEQRMWETYRDSNVAPDQLPARLANIDVESAEVLVEDRDIDFRSREGREAVREVKTRIGQGFFRKMILSQYNGQCCITGLNVPEVLRASHITSWKDDPPNRLNPANGLCLSATYDAARYVRCKSFPGCGENGAEHRSTQHDLNAPHLFLRLAARLFEPTERVVLSAWRESMQWQHSFPRLRCRPMMFMGKLLSDGAVLLL